MVEDFVIDQLSFQIGSFSIVLAPSQLNVSGGCVFSVVFYGCG